MKRLIRRLTRLEIVLIYLVILAGSVVRMTGSGMGCPDWPKCFGYLIPPTERSQLEWQPHREFKKGQIIIVEEELQVAQSDFTSSDKFQSQNWSTYTKHDYALFNAFHTWTEYINRLIGALSGIPMLALVMCGLYFIRKDWRIVALALVGLFLLGFEAWLGKKVVDGNLIPGSITIHMMGALSIVTILMILLGMNMEFREIRFSGIFRNMLILSLILTILQIVIGTQVREQVDHLNEAGVFRQEWIANLNWQFYVHRSFSILIVALNAWLWWKNRNGYFGIRELSPIMLLIIMELILGISLNYFGMPKLSQPLHLLLGTILFGLHVFAVVRMSLASKSGTVSAMD